MKTRMTDLFGIKYPIIQSGMHYVGFSELAEVYPRVMLDGEVDSGA
jgi:NAD(P)H-dependent flavin oxidoreductase YrpB (nitropropane dioxygenase family)